MQFDFIPLLGSPKIDIGKNVNSSRHVILLPKPQITNTPRSPYQLPNTLSRAISPYSARHAVFEYHKSQLFPSRIRTKICCRYNNEVEIQGNRRSCLPVMTIIKGPCGLITLSYRRKNVIICALLNRRKRDHSRYKGLSVSILTGKSSFPQTKNWG